MRAFRRLKRYTIAKYPAGRWVDPRPARHGRLARGGALSLFALTIIESAGCDHPFSTTGRTGGSPPPAELVTEADARGIIERYFADGGIGFTNDVLVRLSVAPGDTIDLDVDGYNDSLRVGYEYVMPAGDADWYDPDVVRELDRRMTAGGPCIDPIPALRVGPDAEAAIRAQVEAFMDTLRTHGVI